MTNIEEIWKDIPGFEGLYQASNLGRILSIKRNSVLKGYLHHAGYLMVCITSINKVSSNLYIHRLVALTWVENINNEKTVDHINNIKLDNRASNLCWMSQNDNVRKARSRPIAQYTLDGEFIRVWKSGVEVIKHYGVKVSGVCDKPTRSMRGFRWRYKF